MLGIACFRLAKMVVTAQELPIDKKNQHKIGIKYFSKTTTGMIGFVH